MRGAGVRRLLLLAGLLPALALAQAAPPAPADSLRPAPTFSVDTSRTANVVTPTNEPSDKVTRPLAIRITAAIVLLTLSTLILYNVRSR
ncbi:hypothetical protein GCM10023185_09930 [Hymenobacter saemangeumensis]|uniref:Uncharacterized protein n=1 Tax=Hymenobacter saemangeumensis TaxID=1084522 RepID=A0ABP8I4P1_9BACT